MRIGDSRTQRVRQGAPGWRIRSRDKSVAVISILNHDLLTLCRLLGELADVILAWPREPGADAGPGRCSTVTPHRMPPDAPRAVAEVQLPPHRLEVPLLAILGSLVAAIAMAPGSSSTEACAGMRRYARRRSRGYRRRRRSQRRGYIPAPVAGAAVRSRRTADLRRVGVQEPQRYRSRYASVPWLPSRPCGSHAIVGPRWGSPRDPPTKPL